MLEVLHSRELWSSVAKARGRGRGPVTAAVAYANEDHLKLRGGDTLICDASDARIETGATTHKLLRALSKRKVNLFHLPRLHAKVVRLPQHVVVGSANMTSNALSLVEAAILTDDAEALRQVDRMLDGLKKQRRLEAIDQDFLDRISTIKVLHSGGGGGATQDGPRGRGPVTWLMAYVELSEREQLKSDPLVAAKIQAEAAPAYFRATQTLAKNRALIQRGDTLLLVHLEERRVRRPIEVTGVVEAGKHLFYLHDNIPSGGLAWERVQSKLKQAGVHGKTTIPAQLALDQAAAALVCGMFRPINLTLRPSARVGR